MNKVRFLLILVLLSTFIMGCSLFGATKRRTVQCKNEAVDLFLDGDNRGIEWE